MAINEVIVDWQAENTAGGLSVMYFVGGANIPLMRTAIDTMYTDFAARLDSLTTWTVRTSGKVLDETTGTLTGFWNDATAATGSGSLSGIPVSNATQALLRWRTVDIVNGRLLQGRTFVPGLGTAAMDGGQLASATITDIQDAQAAFLVTADDGFVIWHRPTESTPGSTGTVTSGAVWNELSVLRRRR